MAVEKIIIFPPCLCGFSLAHLLAGRNGRTFRKIDKIRLILCLSNRKFIQGTRHTFQRFLSIFAVKIVGAILMSDDIYKKFKIFFSHSQLIELPHIATEHVIRALSRVYHAAGTRRSKYHVVR